MSTFSTSLGQGIIQDQAKATAVPRGVRGTTARIHPKRYKVLCRFEIASAGQVNVPPIPNGEK